MYYLDKVRRAFVSAPYQLVLHAHHRDIAFNGNQGPPGGSGVELTDVDGD
jgi:hypothetical protein